MNENYEIISDVGTKPYTQHNAHIALIRFN